MFSQLLVLVIDCSLPHSRSCYFRGRNLVGLSSDKKGCIEQCRSIEDSKLNPEKDEC